MLPSNTFFFDIETTGFDPHRGSVVSISYGKPGQKVESLYSEPRRGARMYRWVEKNVWDPIKERVSRKEMRSEKEMIGSFVGALAKEKTGTTLSGWNIGYEIADVDQRVGSGFDISFLMSRAKAHGLEGKLSQQFNRFDIRDLGQEYAAKLAQEAPQYKNVIEKNVFEQFKGYSQKVSETDPVRAARVASTVPGGVRLAGWKQEVLHKQIFPDTKLQAHISSEDVRGGLQLGMHEGPIFRNKEEAATWGRNTRISSLVNQSVSTGQRSDIPGNKFQYLLEQARTPKTATGGSMVGMEADFLSQLRSTVSEQGGSIDEVFRGEGMKTKPFSVYQGPIAGSRNKLKLAQLGDDIVSIAGKHKIAFAAGAAALGIFALQPGGWFSSKDNDFNTIEGLPHGGTAQRMRQTLTDFGSGTILQKVVNRASQFYKRFRIKGIVPRVKGEFSISAHELGSMSEKQIAGRLGRGTSIHLPLSPEEVYQQWRSGAEKFRREGLVLNRTKLSRLNVEQIRSALDPDFRKNLTSSLDITGVGRPAAQAKRLVSNTSSNIIEGLSHTGISGTLRKDYNFGSGWRGILKVPASLEKYFAQHGGSAMAISKTDLPGFLRKQIVPRALKSGASKTEQALINKDLNFLVKESTKSKYDDVILANIGTMKKEAKSRGAEWKDYFKGTIKHERFHQALTQSGNRSELLSSVSVPFGFSRQIKKAYKKQGVGITPELLKEEYLAHSITESYLTKTPDTMFKKGITEVRRIEETLNQFFLKKKHIGPIIEGPETLARNIAMKRQRKMQVAHRQAQISSSKNASMSGKRHRQKNRSIVQ